MMEDLTGRTPTELLKMINDTRSEHERLKQEIVSDTLQVDGLEMEINKKLEKLAGLERSYVELIEELSKRENVIR
jgi:hypothetical protein